MIDVLIIEDEPPAARRMAAMIGRHLPEPTMRHATNLKQARALLSDKPADIVCLDLNLQGHDGFGILKELSSQSTVIVVSAYTDRALEAFDHGVADFVSKPVSEERLRVAIDRALNMRKTNAKAIPLRSHRGIELVPLGEIVSASALDDYSEISLVGGRIYMEDQSLALLEHRAVGHLMRIHRSHLMNPTHVREIHSGKGSTTAQLSNGLELPISRRKVRTIKAALGLSIQPGSQITA